MTTDETQEGQEEEEEAEPEEFRRLRDAIDEIVGLDVRRDLIRSRDLGTASFAGSEPLFEEVVRFAKRLQPLPWQLLTTSIADNLANRLETLSRHLEEVREFTLEQPNPPAARDSLVAQVEGSFNQARETAFAVVGYLSWESIDLDEMRSQVTAVVADARSQVDETVEELERKRSEADKVLEAIRGASVVAGVAHHAEVFAAAAKRHEDASGRWLWASVIAGLLTGVAAVLLVLAWDVNGDISDASVLQLVVAKGVLLTVGFYLTVNCVRVYKSQAHLSVVNRHRETSLRTFRAFAEGTDDTQVKDKVLLEATHAVFGQTETGLIDSRGSRDTIEVLDGVTGLLRRSQ